VCLVVLWLLKKLAVGCAESCCEKAAMEKAEDRLVQ
jgi:hypothetical protein